MEQDFRKEYLKNLGKLIERCELLATLEDFSLQGPNRDGETKLRLSKRLDARGLEEAIEDVFAEHAFRILEFRDGEEAEEFNPRADDANQEVVTFSRGWWNRAQVDLIANVIGVTDPETQRHHRYAWDLASAALPELRKRQRHFTALVTLLVDAAPPRASGLLDFGGREAIDMLSSLT